jgi:hypothetical protein
LRPLQGILTKAAVELIPVALRDRIGLGKAWSLAPWQRRLVCRAGAAADPAHSQHQPRGASVPAASLA